MKKLLLPSLAPCLGFMLICQLRMLPRIALAADARPIAGDWEGTLNPGAQPKKHVVVHISAEQDGSLSGTIDYPDQDTSGIAITAITYKDPALHFESNPNLCVYDGTVNQDDTEIVGTWKQDGSSLSLTLKRTR
ncbi:MAG: hypothetical protein WCA47_09270 [Terriglobales bacterium]